MNHSLTWPTFNSLLPLPSQVAQSQQDALDFIQQLVETEGIDCGFTRGDAYLLPGRSGPAHDKDSSVSGPNAGRQLLDKELSAAIVAGLKVEAVSGVGEGGGGAAGGPAGARVWAGDVAWA
jgi:hypothetical protein